MEVREKVDVEVGVDGGSGVGGGERCSSFKMILCLLWRLALSDLSCCAHLGTCRSSSTSHLKHLRTSIFHCPSSSTAPRLPPPSNYAFRQYVLPPTKWSSSQS